MLDMYKPHKVCVLDLVQLEGDLCRSTMLLQLEVQLEDDRTRSNTETL